MWQSTQDGTALHLLPGSYISDEAALIQYQRWVTIPMYFTRDSCQLDCSWAASGLALSSLGATETLYTQSTAQQDSNVRCLQAIIWGRSSVATFNTFDVIKPLKKRHFKKKVERRIPNYVIFQPVSSEEELGRVIQNVSMCMQCEFLKIYKRFDFPSCCFVATC